MHCFLITLSLLAFIMAPFANEKVIKLEASEYSPVGSVGSMVGIHVDYKNRVHVTHTSRRNNGALDIRRHPDWVIQSLASGSIADKRAMIRGRKSGSLFFIEITSSFKEGRVILESFDERESS